jgi:branched-chain amino acid transport system ATP-binding protein
MLRVDRLRVAYGDVEVVHGINLEVGAGEAVGIIGSNGAGKSTLLRAVCGLQPVTGGDVIFEGRSIVGHPAFRIARSGLVYVPAERRLFPEMTVWDNLSMGAYPRRPGSDRREAVMELFPRLRERRRQAAGTLSGGEQQMLAIGRALMAEPRLLLLDEASTGLAPVLADEVYGALHDLCHEQHLTLVIAEQQVALALGLVDRAYVVEGGRVRLQGTATDLRDRSGRPARLPRPRLMAIVLDGIVFGLQLSLLAVGLTLIYGLGGVLNLAHGQLAVVGAITGAVLLSAGAPIPVAVVAAIAGAAALAWLLDATLLRPVYRLTGQQRCC